MRPTVEDTAPLHGTPRGADVRGPSGPHPLRVAPATPANGRLGLASRASRATRVLVQIPDDLHWLFWDVEPSAVRLPEHRDYVLERVMSRGGWGAMRWLQRAFPREVLADFLRRRGGRLAPRELAYSRLVAGVEGEDRPGGGRPSWAG
jgi:hypothetical protein